MGTLEEYLLAEMAEGKIDFRFRASVDDKGRVMIYIHPDGKSGCTTPMLRVKHNLVVEP